MAASAKPQMLADLPVEALSQSLLCCHDLFGVTVAGQGLVLQLKDQLIIVAEVVPDHRGQSEMAEGSRPSALEELLGCLLQIIGQCDLKWNAHRPALQTERAVIGVDLDLGLAAWTAGVDLGPALVLPRGPAFAAQLHCMYIVEHSR